ncbi:MAG: hypothetical protein WA790_05940 [Sulfitobacter sp.]
MDVWAENFLWVAVSISLLGWFVVGQLWSCTSSTLKNAFVSIFASTLILSCVGSIAAILSHTFSIGFKDVYQAILSDFLGASAYFFETGFETAALWLPIILTKVTVLLLRNLNARK